MPRSQSATGSSPRVPGTAVCDDQRAGTVRFIPACAGNGHSSANPDGSTPVHPRVCGERFEVHVIRCFADGSSPRVRGTAFPVLHDRAERRFIPACAGNGGSGGGCSTGSPVHPRVCGERKPRSVVRASFSGSSPRVRGTGRRRGSPNSRTRFIPACAGNGDATWLRSRRTPVHPRVCGERRLIPDRKAPFDGSSPRVRGTGRRGKPQRP